MKKHTVIPLILMCSVLLLVTGCWIPEEFETAITVKKDGSYTFTYEGKLANVFALASDKEGKLGKKEEAELKKDVEKLKQEPGFKSVKYMGKGRYRVSVAIQGKAGENYHFLSKDMKLFSVESGNEGTLKISAYRASEKDLQQLNAIGANMDGILSVTTETGVMVLEHNADKIQKKTNTYQWTIKSFSSEPFITLKMTP
jgi:hypothetical protein